MSDKSFMDHLKKVGKQVKEHDAFKKASEQARDLGEKATQQLKDVQNTLVENDTIRKTVNQVKDMSQAVATNENVQKAVQQVKNTGATLASEVNKTVQNIYQERSEYLKEKKHVDLLSEINMADRQVLADLYLSKEGSQFVEDIVTAYGSRFGGSDEERAAADFIKAKMESYGLDSATKESFDCLGWVRKNTILTVTAPHKQILPCIALPFCPPGQVEAPIVYLGDGDPQAYADNREAIKGSIVMVLTATPKFYHRGMHRGEKLGRALEAGAVGFIWMRGEPGGLPETGSARFNRACEVPAISVSYETGHEILRMMRHHKVAVKIESDHIIQPTHSFNVIGELKGNQKPEEVIVIGAHYDGHDISQSANDDGAGVAVVMEAARALASHKALLTRSIRFVAFAQEEMGLIGSEHYVQQHDTDQFVFMLNLDGAGRGPNGTFALQGWSEATSFFKSLLKTLHETHIAVGDRISLYSDMYNFAAKGIPSAAYASAAPASSGAPRGWGHTYWDSLDKLDARAIQMDAIFVARLILQLATMDHVPLNAKTPKAFGDKLKSMGFDEILKYELREIPGEKE